MRIPPHTILLLLALLVLSLTGLTACGGKAARERSQALLESQSGEKWFCQIAEDQTNWDCVQSNELAAAPVPERMPVPRPEPVVTDAASISEQALEIVEVEVDEPETDGTDVVATEVVETDVVELKIDETDVVETATGELTIDETDIVETATGELTIDETDIVETETGELDAVVTAVNSADRPRAELYALPDDAYVVQLVAMRSARTLDHLINDRGLTDVIPVRVAANGETYHILLIGPYDDEPSAQEVAAVPPDDLQDFQPWVRSVRSLKAAMREADELSANSADDQG